jgi:hypothetical protein
VPNNRSASAFISAALVAALVMVAPAVAQAGTLDQQQTDGTGTGLQINSGHSVTETFTPGLAGPLDQVDLWLRKATAPTLPLNVEIRSVSNTTPTGTVLASAVIQPSAVSTSAAFVPIVFSAPTSVATGTQYAIVAWSAALSSNDYVWALSTAHDTYPRGLAADANSSPPTTPWTAFLSDLAFKTYVVVPPSPPQQTGKRSAALKKCKKKHSHKARKKCKKKANKLPL